SSSGRPGRGDTGGSGLARQSAVVPSTVRARSLAGRPASLTRGTGSAESGRTAAAERSAAMTRPVLEVSGLSKNFESEGAPVRALRGVDLTIAQGEFIAVMGPSGCGKSTLLNLVAGLDAPRDGQVVLVGEELVGRDENELARIRREHIGVVFQ